MKNLRKIFERLFTFPPPPPPYSMFVEEDIYVTERSLSCRWDVRLRRRFLIQNKTALNLLSFPIQVPYVSPEMNKTKRVKFACVVV